jgi:hypothetical protein
MADSHDEWLQEQGARVIEKRSLRRAFFQPFSFSVIDDINDTINYRECEEHLYKIEVTSATLKKWQMYEARLEHVIRYADEHDTSPTNFYIDNRAKHNDMMVNNPMYREAWKEFQSIRALLGQDTHWP